MIEQIHTSSRQTLIMVLVVDITTQSRHAKSTTLPRREKFTNTKRLIVNVIKVLGHLNIDVY